MRLDGKTHSGEKSGIKIKVCTQKHTFDLGHSLVNAAGLSAVMHSPK